MRPVLPRYEDAIEELVEFFKIAWSRDETIQLLMNFCDCYPAVILVLDALDEVMTFSTDSSKLWVNPKH
jgi:hypothetical protein